MGTEENHELLLGVEKGRQVTKRLLQYDHILFNTYYLETQLTQNPEFVPNF